MQTVACLPSPAVLKRDLRDGRAVGQQAPRTCHSGWDQRLPLAVVVNVAKNSGPSARFDSHDL